MGLPIPGCARVGRRSSDVNGVSETRTEKSLSPPAQQSVRFHSVTEEIHCIAPRSTCHHGFRWAPLVGHRHDGAGRGGIVSVCRPSTAYRASPPLAVFDCEAGDAAPRSVLRDFTHSPRSGDRDRRRRPVAGAVDGRDDIAAAVVGGGIRRRRGVAAPVVVGDTSVAGVVGRIGGRRGIGLPTSPASSTDKASPRPSTTLATSRDEMSAPASGGSASGPASGGVPSRTSARSDAASAVSAPASTRRSGSRSWPVSVAASPGTSPLVPLPPLKQVGHHALSGRKCRADDPTTIRKRPSLENPSDAPAHAAGAIEDASRSSRR